MPSGDAAADRRDWAASAASAGTQRLPTPRRLAAAAPERPRRPPPAGAHRRPRPEGEDHQHQPPRQAAGPAPQRWAPLKVVTTQMRPAWLRKNGVPYSENAVMTEHFIRFADDSDEWFTVVTIVEDPTYLTQSFITSTNFKREADGARFKPVACKAS